MDESEDNMSSEDFKASDSPLTVKSKPKKRSLIERELETSLTSRITSPVSIGDGTSTSRYGRARRLKSEIENSTDTKKVSAEIKSPQTDKSPVKTQSPVYKMHASNSPLRSEPPKLIGVETFLENQIESIYQENISLSRFGTEEVKKTSPSPAKKFPKVYIRKDLIQKRDSDENVAFIKNMTSPMKSAKKSSSTHLNNILERSSERYSIGSAKQQNGFIDNSSVVKTLDFDSKKKKNKEYKDNKTLSKSDLFDLEANCAYQVGDLAWARMGTYPFWPCIVTRDPSNGIFVKKKLFGRIERDVIHVTFFGDNGRRGWIVDSMLRKYLGQLEFENTRQNFTPEDKKKDPRLFAAFFVSEKKQALWNNSVEEAEMLLREPKRLRIDIFNDMLEKSRTKVKQQKSGKISRTDSDVSLSESLYDSLFSEDDGKTDNSERSRNRTRNKSLDMFEVVTACLDNMAAKTGITKIQRQSHMDRWLQKAKSKTPEKTQAKPLAPQVKVEEKKETKVTNSKKKKNLSRSRVAVNKPYSLRKSMTESQNMIQFPNDHDYSKNVVVVTDSDHNSTDTDSCKNFASQEHTGIVASIESPSTKPEESEKDVDTIENEGTTGDKDVKVENPTVILPKINGSCETSEGESVDESSQNSNIVNTAASPGNNNKTKGDNSAHVSFYQDEVEEACESRANTPDPVTIREQMISPVYEDSFDEVQYSRALIDRNHTENEEITPNCKPVEATADSQDEMTNEDSTLESNEPSSMSVDEDGDYKPDYETESQTDDNCSSNGAPLTNDSILDTQQDIYDDTISDVPIKKNVAIEIDSSVSHGEFNNEITNDVPSKLNKEFILDRYGADLDLDHVTEVLEIKQISNGLDSEVENSNQFSFSKKLEEDKILDRNEDAIKFPISISNISDEISNHDMVESITRNGPLNGNLNVKEIDMNTAKEVHIPVFKPDMIKENGFHNEEAHMNGDIDLDSISILSEDSVTSTKSESKRKLRSKDKKTRRSFGKRRICQIFRIETRCHNG